MRFRRRSLNTRKVIFGFLIGLNSFLGVESGWASGGIRVISDIDDTTKITHVSSSSAAIWNALFSSRAFAGMSDFYTALVGSRGYAIHYLTAAPPILRFQARSFLAKNDFPPGELHTRNPLSGESIKDYKKRVVLALMEKHPQDQFILIGDDTQSDFVAYDEVYHLRTERILAIYIRRVTNRILPPSVYPFLSAFDMAQTEHRMDRLTVAEAAPVAHAILSERRAARIIPRFSYCPTPHPQFVTDPKVEEWSERIFERILKICTDRL